MSALVICTSCSRHIAVSETACPFCGAPRPESEAPEVPPSPPRSLPAPAYGMPAPRRDAPTSPPPDLSVTMYGMAPMPRPPPPDVMMAPAYGIPPAEHAPARRPVAIAVVLMAIAVVAAVVWFLAST